MTTVNLQTDTGKPEPAKGRAGAMDEIREAMKVVRKPTYERIVDGPDGLVGYRTPAYTAACELLARWLVEHAGELVRVRPLEWEDWIDSEGLPASRAISVFSILYVQCDHDEWYWKYCVDEYYDEGMEACESLADGKAKAEQWYRTRLAAAMEPLFGEGGK